MSKEIWLPVKGFEGRYEVSNFGSIRSLDMYINNPHGSKSFKKGRTLRQTKNGKGYLAVKLCLNGLQKSLVVHRIVAEAFVPNKMNYPQVNHLNGIKSDNRTDNLEWCTNRQNIIHAYNNGLIKTNKGEAHHMSKLKQTEVDEIRVFLSNGETMSSLARKYSVTVTSIYHIKIKKTWI
jgi:hypothetical protein